MDTSALKYPKKSHRKSILIPSESIRLAELIGIIFGDGGINNNWQLVISLNANSDLSFSLYVSNLIISLFDIVPHIRKRPGENTLAVVSSSTNLLDFLVSKGAVRGNKIAQSINIPLWIQNNSSYEKYFVRGLVDTDGCLFIHKHMIKRVEYKNIGFCFTSFSPLLTASVAHILHKNDITPHITDSNHRIYLYKQNDVLKYLHTFGSSNPRILNKYQEWANKTVSSSKRV